MESELTLLTQQKGSASASRVVESVCAAPLRVCALIPATRQAEPSALCAIPIVGELARRGHDVTVLFVPTAGARRSSRFLAFARTALRAARAKADLLHLFGCQPEVVRPGVLAARWQRVPVILQVDDAESCGIGGDRGGLRAAAHHLNAAIAGTENLEDSLATLGMARESLFHIPAGGRGRDESISLEEMVTRCEHVYEYVRSRGATATQLTLAGGVHDNPPA